MRSSSELVAQVDEVRRSLEVGAEVPLLRGHADRRVLVLALGPGEVRAVFLDEPSVVRVIGPGALELLVHGRNGRRVAVVTPAETLVFELDAEWDPRTGRWRSPVGVSDRLTAHLGSIRKNRELVETSVSEFLDAEMAAVGRALIALDLAFWPYVEALARAARSTAIDALAMSWPTDHEDFQHVTYARLHFMLPTRASEVRAFLETTDADRWPYLYRHNDRLNGEPNLFAAVGLWDRAVTSSKRSVADEEVLARTSGWGLARSVADLATYLLRGGTEQAAWDALTDSQALDFDSVASAIDHARLLSLLGEHAAALEWVRFARVRVAVKPDGKASTLADMVEAKRVPGTVITLVGHGDFDALRESSGDALGRMLDDPPTKLELEALRKRLRKLERLREMLCEGSDWVERGAFSRAEEVLVKALAASAEKGAPYAGALPSLVATALGHALQELGREGDALAVIEQVSTRSRGVCVELSLLAATLSAHLGRSPAATRWLTRARAVVTHPDDVRQLTNASKSRVA